MTQSEREDNFKKLFILVGNLQAIKSLKEKLEAREYELVEKIGTVKNLLRGGRNDSIGERR